MTELENLQKQYDIMDDKLSVLFDIIARLENGQPYGDLWDEYITLDDEHAKLQEGQYEDETN